MEACVQGLGTWPRPRDEGGPHLHAEVRKALLADEGHQALLTNWRGKEATETCLFPGVPLAFPSLH